MYADFAYHDTRSKTRRYLPQGILIFKYWITPTEGLLKCWIPPSLNTFVLSSNTYRFLNFFCLLMLYLLSNLGRGPRTFTGFLMLPPRSSTEGFGCYVNNIIQVYAR